MRAWNKRKRPKHHTKTKVIYRWIIERNVFYSRNIKNKEIIFKVLFDDTTATKADYIIINTTGNRILDIYKLKDCFVSENGNTDGLNFRHPVTGSHITIQGDVKVLRNPTREEWDKYKEYHYDELFCKNL